MIKLDRYYGTKKQLKIEPEEGSEQEKLLRRSIAQRNVYEQAVQQPPEQTPNAPKPVITTNGVRYGDSSVYNNNGYGGEQGLQTWFYSRLSQFINAAKANGINVTGFSGFRTKARSAALGGGKRKGVAAPGNSWHNYGLAADITVNGSLWSNPSRATLSRAQDLAARFGLYIPMLAGINGSSLYEPWHIQPVEAKTGGVNGNPIPYMGGGNSKVSGSPLPTNPYMSQTYGAAQNYQVPYGILSGLLYKESSYNPKSVSSAGAQGIAQFMPGTWSGTWNKHKGSSPFDPNAAIPASALYLRTLYNGTPSNLPDTERWKMALSAYNSGNPNKYKSSDDVNDYVNSIMAYYGYNDKQAKFGVDEQKEVTQPGWLRPKLSNETNPLQQKQLGQEYDFLGLRGMATSAQEAMNQYDKIDKQNSFGYKMNTTSEQYAKENPNYKRWRNYFTKGQGASGY